MIICVVQNWWINCDYKKLHGDILNLVVNVKQKGKFELNVGMCVFKKDMNDVI